VDTETTCTPFTFGAGESLSHVLAAGTEDWFTDTLLAWNAIQFDASVVDSWTPFQARQGLVALERLTRSVAAVKTSLVGQLKAGRDTTATIVRETGMSRRSARELRSAAKVINEHPDALATLASGDVSTEHLAHLAHLTTEMAGEVLQEATGKCADDYKTLVDTHRVRRESKSVEEEQHNSRSVKFFTKPNGCVGMTIVLPPVEGNELKASVAEMCDRMWKDKHPNRADALGGHDDEPYERRLADAFIRLMRGERAGGKPSVVVVIDADTLESHVVPNQPISTRQAMQAMVRGDVYAAIRDQTKPAQLKFGRNKRVASPLQKLALLMQGETCIGDGCNVSALQCDAHHVRWFEHGGTTDLENLEWRCHGEQGHHPHIHETGPPG
jgi:hypothetical protein